MNLTSIFFSQKKNALRKKPTGISEHQNQRMKSIVCSASDHIQDRGSGTVITGDGESLSILKSFQTTQSSVSKYKSKLVISVASDHPLTKHSYLGHWFAELTNFITTGARLRGYSVDVTIEADPSPDLPEFQK